MDFTNKVVIVTGASSGIGAGAAEHFSKLGANLVLTGRNEANLKKAAEKCKGKGQVLSLVSDVNNQADREKVLKETIKTFGKIDVLVNNAGIGERNGILTTTAEVYDFVMETNVRSVFLLTQLVVPHLIKSKGCIVNISSVAGLRANPSAMTYSMSKAALDQFTKCLALELAAQGVRVNSVNPAMITTEFHKRLGMDDKTYQEYSDRQVTTYAMGRIGTVDDTSHAIAFLACNEASSFITGTLLAVDGGKATMCSR